MSRVSTTEVVIGAVEVPADDAEETAPPARKPSKSGAAKADAVIDTEETP
jgi:hypothetical protein